MAEGHRLSTSFHAYRCDHSGGSNGEQRRQQIGLEPQHQRLAFRIAEADIVFDELWRAVLDHQPGIEHALELRAGLRHRRAPSAR